MGHFSMKITPMPGSLLRGNQHRTATVIFDNATTSAETIAAASANAGYPARVVK